MLSLSARFRRAKILDELKLEVLQLKEEIGLLDKKMQEIVLN